MKVKTLNSILLLVVIMASILLLSSCADAQPQVNDCLVGHQYGFWGGLWHGIISPISFFGSLFSNDIDMFAINNNGGWYTFGFVLGSGILFNLLTFRNEKN